MNRPALHYVVEGRSDPGAPALLLIHPIGGSLEVWNRVMPLLQSRFRVVRYDQRGHGGTPATPGPYTIEALARDALDLLDQLEIERAAICGTSLGGMIGLWLGAHAASRVSRLALLCTSAHLAPPEAWRERAALVRRSGVAAVAAASVARWFTPEFAATHPELVQQLQEMVARTSVEGYAACCEAIASWDIRDRLPAIEATTWILAGGADPSTPPAHAYALGAAIPNARVTVVEQAAHLALAEHPARVGQWLLEHLDPEWGSNAGTDDNASTRAGERVRREVLGDAHVDRAQAAATELTAPFQEFITRYAWGEVWGRPGLSRPERSLITLGILAARRHDEEFALHVRAALRNGVSIEQLREMLLHVAIYAGVPAANHAFAITQRVIDEA